MKQYLFSWCLSACFIFCVVFSFNGDVGEKPFGQRDNCVALLERLDRIERQFIGGQSSCGDAALDTQLIHESQQLCRQLGIDEGMLNFESFADAIGTTRAVCTSCNLSQNLINFQAQVDHINSTLDQIELTLASMSCRTTTAVTFSADEFPYTVLRVGTSVSYLLTSSNSTAGYEGTSPAITVEGGDRFVTIDLGGNTIFMGSTDQPAISIGGSCVEIVIKNGRIVWVGTQNAHCIEVGGTISPSYALRFENLTLTGSGDSGSSGCGLYMDNVTQVIVSNVTADKNKEHGFKVIATNASNSTEGITFINSRARGNGSDGFHFETLSGNAKRGTMIRNCNAMSNGRYGFYADTTVGALNDVLFRSNIALSNGDYGFYMNNNAQALQLVNNIAKGNGGAVSPGNYFNINATYTPVTSLASQPFGANVSL